MRVIYLNENCPDWQLKSWREFPKENIKEDCCMPIDFNKENSDKYSQLTNQVKLSGWFLHQLVKYLNQPVRCYYCGHMIEYEL